MNEEPGVDSRERDRSTTGDSARASTPVAGPSRADVARGTAWAAVDNWTQQIFQFTTFLVVGNVIGPEPMGVMAMVLVFALLMHAVLTNSFTDALIQRQHVDREHLDAAFWAIATAGAAAALLGVALAQPLSLAFRTPEVERVALALTPIYLLMALSAFFEARLRRELRFNILALRSVLAAGIACAVAIVLSLRGFGIWSLVVYQIVWRAIELGVLFGASRYVPSGNVSGRHLRDLSGFGLNTVLARFIGYLALNVDRVLVGAVLGPAALGIYTMALRFVEALTQALAGVMQSVAFPVFSRLQDETEKLATALRQAARLSNLVGLPVFAGLAVVAEPLIGLLLQPQWAPMIPVLQILCLIGAMNTVSYFIGAALRAIGRADQALLLQALTFILKAIAVVALVKAGLVAVALGQAVVPLVMTPIWLYFLNRKVPLGGARFFVDYLPAIGASLAMMATVVGTRTMLEGHIASLPLLGAMVATGIAAYAVIASVSSRDLRLLAARFLSRKTS